MKPSPPLALLLAILAAGAVHAMCMGSPGTKVVRAGILRCESAAPYLEAAAHSKQTSLVLVRSDEVAHPGLIAVVAIESELLLTDLTTAEWTVRREHARLWWTGPLALCEPSKPDAVEELEITAPCCDTVPPRGACLGDFAYAGPVSVELHNLIAPLSASEP